MREPMTGSDRVIRVCIFAASAAVSILVIWATVHFAVPWIVDRIQEQIDDMTQDRISWTIGIIQESPTPRRVEYANHVEYVWE
jgi:hypothetical protein